MSGRAGRPLYDDVGYSYLIAKTMDDAFNLQAYYVDGEIEKTNSKLIDTPKVEIQSVFFAKELLMR